MTDRQKIIFVGLAVIVFIISIVVSLQILKPSTRSIIPPAYSRKVSFPLYQPQPLPSGFNLKTDSFSANQNVLSYTYNYNQSQAITVNIQALPSGFDASTFNPTKQFSTPVGQAYLADTGDRVTTAVVNSRSLILINAPGGISNDIMEQFVSSLREIKTK